MTDARVQEYYEMLKYYYLKSDSDWTDKAKSVRTIAHDFYKEISRTYGTYAEALKEFYRWSRYDDVSKAAFCLKDKLNDVVHHNKQIDKGTFVTYYSMLVRLVYLATGVLPDEATMVYIGCKTVDELDGLNDEQKDAVLCNSQIIYVSAGPGTGKTHLLINKLLYYITSSSSPERIVALSYTNTAANELGEKFRLATFNTSIEKPYFFYNGTLHSFCFKLMKSYNCSIGKEFNYIIIDDSDIAELAEELRIQFNDNYSKEEIKLCLKSKLKSKDPQLQQLITELKAKYNIISIDDILTLFIDRIGESGFRSWLKDQVSILVVDEAQDLTALNYRIFDLMLAINPQMKMFLVGDARQNIFGFIDGSYAHLDAFLKRHSDYTRKNLTGTYRCPQSVCDYVNTFHFIDCDNVPLRSVGNTTGFVRVCPSFTEYSEAMNVFDIVKQIDDINNTAILSPKLNYLNNLIDLLIDAGIPYKVFGGQKLVKRHIKIFNHLLRIIDSDNVYSINAINRAFMLQIDKMSGKNNVERFYNTTEGLFIKDIKEDIARRVNLQEPISMRNLAKTIIDRYLLASANDAVKADFVALETLIEQFNSISDYLLSFAIDRETFSRFIEKNYTECKVPIKDKFLTISTIHSAKGLEWKNVIIMGLSENNFPNMWFVRDKSDYEKSVFLNDLRKSMYVAATRAKGDLYLTYAQKSRGYTQEPSRFLRGVL